MLAQPPLSIAGSCYFGPDALTCLLDQLTAAAGGPALFGLLLGCLLFAVFYVAAEGNIATPTVVLVLTSTVWISMVPDNYGEIGYGIVMIGLAAALWQVVQKYVLQRAVR